MTLDLAARKSSMLEVVREDVAWRDLPGLGVYLVHRRSQDESLLNATAGWLWKNMLSPISVEALVARASRAFRVPTAIAERDVLDCVTRLHRSGQLRVSGATLEASSLTGRRLIDANAAVRRHFACACVPYSTQLVVTTMCQYRCRHCYIDDFGIWGVAAGVLIVALRDLAALGGIHLRISGGEPLLRPDLLSICDAAYRYHFSWTLNTNGRLVDAAFAKALARLQPTEVDVSLYGARRETHAAVTGVHGSFDRSLHAIECLRSEGISVGVNFLLMAHNYFELEAVRALAEQYGARMKVEHVVFPKRNGATDPLCLRVGRRELEAMAGRVGPPPPALCAPARCKMSIDAAGDVHPCEMIWRPLGNIRRQRLVNVWRAAPIAQECRTWHFEEPRECTRCDVRPTCFRCPGLSQLEEGSYAARSRFLCMVRRVLGTDPAAQVAPGRLGI